MKAKLLFVLFLALTNLDSEAQVAKKGGNAGGQEPAPVNLLGWDAANRGSFSIDAKPARYGKSTKDDFKTDYGSYDKNIVRTVALDVELKNFSRVSQTVIIETLWFVRPERPPASGIGGAYSKVFLSERDIGMPTELLAGKGVKQESATVTKSSRTRYVALGESYSGGLKPAGWIVLARIGELVVAYKASSPTLDALVKRSNGSGIVAELKDLAADIAKN